MSGWLFLVTAAAGGLGAGLRFVLDGVIRSRTRVRLPLGTMTINVTGSLLLGLLTGLATAGIVSDGWRVALGTGLLGGYTTFSTASFETVRLIQERRIGAGLAVGLGTLVLSVAAAGLGYAIAAVIAR